MFLGSIMTTEPILRLGTLLRSYAVILAKLQAQDAESLKELLFVTSSGDVEDPTSVSRLNGWRS